jgi:hydrogenase maturation protein HypF
MPQLYRYRIRIEGIVQGIGFRPFVFKLASQLSLSGWVNNDTEGVTIEVEGEVSVLEIFVRRLQSDKPTLAKIAMLRSEKSPIAQINFNDFTIRASETTANFSAEVLPDLVTCAECLREIYDPRNRRYQYLFTNCTYCGPRFSITQELPYDRQHTTMAGFAQCEDCLREYEDPRNRRFHAQPNACSRCGPQLALQNQSRQTLAHGFNALKQAIELLRLGQVVALKGIGGYQLVVNASDSKAIAKLRERKNRGRKPFAVMVATVTEAQSYCEISPAELQQLEGPAGPIVLLRRKLQKRGLSDLVAPNNPYLGLFLPSSPLHHWLLKLFGGPLVVTSANRSDEPLAYSEPDVFFRLESLADVYLTHNRPIARPIDDSVLQVVEDRVLVLRSGRGLAPYTHSSSAPLAKGVPLAYGGRKLFATGAHMKNTFALALPKKMILSQHIGDLESERSQNLYEQEVANYLRFYHQQPSTIICDLHPGYFTSDWAYTYINQAGLTLERLQHHRAHIYSTLVENPLMGPFMGVAWDGTGYGDDGTIWGSEFFTSEHSEGPLESTSALDSAGVVQLRRQAALFPFLLLGGEASVRSPWKVALSLLFEIDAELAHTWYAKVHQSNPRQGGDNEETYQILERLWRKPLNSPQCTSMGRFLEGVAALLGLTQDNDFEAEAAIQLEFAATMGDGFESGPSTVSPPLWTKSNLIYHWDWRPWVKAAALSAIKGEAIAPWAWQIHHFLIQSIVEMAAKLGQNQIVLGGGVFQNRLLVQGLLTKGRELGLHMVTPSRVPINDEGIAFGQLNWAGQAKQSKA